jgi:hypothetical protein
MSCVLLHVFAGGFIDSKNIHGMNNIQSVGHMRMDNIMQCLAVTLRSIKQEAGFLTGQLILFGQIHPMVHHLEAALYVVPILATYQTTALF